MADQRIVVGHRMVTRSYAVQVPRAALSSDSRTVESDLVIKTIDEMQPYEERHDLSAVDLRQRRIDHEEWATRIHAQQDEATAPTAEQKIAELQSRVANLEKGAS